MSEKSSQKWNPVAHEALLFAMIEEFRPSKDKIVSIVERMSQQGHHFTFNGVKYLAVPLAHLSFGVLTMPVPSILSTPPANDVTLP